MVHIDLSESVISCLTLLNFDFDLIKRRLESAIEEAEQAVQPHIMNEQEIMHK